MPPPDLTQILTSLTTQSLPTPSKTWLLPILTARSPPPPLPSLLATVRARLLASDLTTPGLLDPSYTTTHSLPPDLSQPQPQIKATTLGRDVVFQVLDIENLSRSRWSQVEELEAIARGEGTKGREVIRLVPTEGEGDGVNAGERGVTQATQTQPTQQQPQARQAAGVGGGGSGGERDTHKLVLQDCKGSKISALELRKVERVGIGKLNIGEKILVKAGAKVSRGVIMLEPGMCVVLGGKVEAWHKAWTEGRLERLKEAAGAGGGGGEGRGR